MDSSTEFARPAQGAKSDCRSPAPSVRQVVGWLWSLPDNLGAALAVGLIFSAAVLTIAALYGAPLVVPQERVSAALGLNAVLPVVFAIVLYIALRLVRVRTGKARPDDRPLGQMIAVDITLMGIFLVVTYFHFSLKIWVQVINPNLYDKAYFAVDEAFRPVLELFYWIRLNIFELVPKTDAWYQGAFLLMFITGFCSLAIARPIYYPRFCLGVLLTLSIGGLSYLVAPAVGPFVFEEGLNRQATEAQQTMYWAHQQAVQHGMAWIKQVGPAYFTGGLAAMPSLHIAQAVVMTYFIHRAGSPLMPLFVVICLWVTVESVASRWHYLIDLPVGFVLAAIVIWLTNRLCDASGSAAPVARTQPVRH